MAARQYRSTVEAKTLSSAINSSVTTITLNSVTTLPNTYPYTLVIDPDTASEEILTVTASAGGKVLTVTRGQDGTSAQSHNAAAVIKHMVTARDLQEPQNHIAASAAVHGVTGSVVGTTDTQTLTNKTLTSPTITGTATLPSTTSIGTVSSTEIGYLDGVTSAIQSQLDLLIPKGMISPYAGATAPTGWLLCDGSAKSVVANPEYSALYTVIGNTYGGTNNTNFQVPDLLGRTPIGAGTGSGLTARTLGTKLGAEGLPEHKHTLSAHTHTTNIDHGHTASASTSVSGGNHGHALIMKYTTASHDHAISGASNPIPAMQGDPSAGDIGNYNNTAVNASGDLSLSGSTSVTVNGTGTDNKTSGGPSTDVTGPAGTGTHGVMQPSTVVNYIIKF